MSQTTQIDPDFAEFYGGLDSDDRWREDCPEFAWTADDLAEFAFERLVAENERLSLAAWWEMEGVRCYTFGRNPQQNPYLDNQP